MFTVTEEVWAFGSSSQEISFHCPSCGEQAEYYVWAPEVCENCGFPVERLLLMEDDLKDKIEYYREGEL